MRYFSHMADGTYEAVSRVIVYDGPAAWRFLALPPVITKEIKEKHGKRAAGWGSLRVLATLGETKWKTSIFPDKQSGTYLLPLKASVRKAEGIVDGAQTRFSIRIR